MRYQTALALSGIVFSLVSILHFVRYFLAIHITIDDAVLPVFWSLPAAICALFLGFLMFFVIQKS